MVAAFWSAFDIYRWKTLHETCVLYLASAELQRPALLMWFCPAAELARQSGYACANTWTSVDFESSGWFSLCWGSIEYEIKCYVLSGLHRRWQHFIAASYFSSSGSGFIYFCFSGPFRPADLKWWLLHANGIKYLSQTAARERTLGINCWPRGKSQNKGSAAVLTNASLYFKKSLVAIPLLNSPGSFLMWNRALAAFQPDLVLLLPLLIHPGASHFCIPLVLEWRNGEQEGDLEQRVRDRKATTKSLIRVGKLPAYWGARAESWQLFS